MFHETTMTWSVHATASAPGGAPCSERAIMPAAGPSLGGVEARARFCAVSESGGGFCGVAIFDESSAVGVGRLKVPDSVRPYGGNVIYVDWGP